MLALQQIPCNINLSYKSHAKKRDISNNNSQFESERKTLADVIHWCKMTPAMGLGGVTSFFFFVWKT